MLQVGKNAAIGFNESSIHGPDIYLKSRVIDSSYFTIKKAPGKRQGRAAGPRGRAVPGGRCAWSPAGSPGLAAAQTGAGQACGSVACIDGRWLKALNHAATAGWPARQSKSG